MAERSCRSVARPRSYKEFSEKGHAKEIPENAIQDQHSLLSSQISDEARDTSSGAYSSQSEDLLAVSSPRKRIR